MKSLITICARGGSKGIPKKNIRSLRGRPLIAHTIDHAKTWGKADDIIVSTDSNEIAEVARNQNIEVPFTRPDSLASDEAAKIPVIQHACQKMERLNDTTYDCVIDLDATAPLRNIDDIEDCYQKLKQTNANNVFTVCESDKNPYFNMVEVDEDGKASLSKELDEEVVRRQDAPRVYEMNASIYAYRRKFLLNTDSVHSDNTRVVVMPPERSVDIDRPIDFKLVKLLMEETNENV